MNEPVRNKEVLDAVEDFCRFIYPDYDVRTRLVSKKLDQSKLLSARHNFVRGTWQQHGKTYRDYFQHGSYLGRVTLDEGNLVTLTLE